MTKTPKTKPNSKNQIIKILQININGIQNKSLELQYLLNNQNIDIAVIQETKLNPTAKAPVIPNYSYLRQDRQNPDPLQKNQWRRPHHLHQKHPSIRETRNSSNTTQ
jgi:hypothetical protein